MGFNSTRIGLKGLALLAHMYCHTVYSFVPPSSSITIKLNNNIPPAEVVRTININIVGSDLRSSIGTMSKARALLSPLLPLNSLKEGYNENEVEKTVTILSRGEHHIVAMKPPSVVCHHSNWTGSRKKKLKKGEEPEVPMLQRIRDGIGSIDNIDNTDHLQNAKIKKKINLVHRLDRGASGILLCTFANEDEVEEEDGNEEGSANDEISTSHASIVEEPGERRTEEKTNYQVIKKIRTKGPTAILQEEMSKTSTIKTYVALVRGEGMLHGEDMKEKGWFEVNRPIKDEKGRLNDATTLFNFVAGQAEPQGEHIDEESRIKQPRISLVLARPQNGRWHQIRRHLNGLSHPILGDTSHGSSKSNREWYVTSLHFIS